MSCPDFEYEWLRKDDALFESGGAIRYGQVRLCLRICTAVGTDTGKSIAEKVLGRVVWPSVRSATAATKSGKHVGLTGTCNAIYRNPYPLSWFT